MDSIWNKAEEIVNQHVINFLNGIHRISEIGPYKKIRRKIPGFAVLNPGNKEFYQYAYYEGMLEGYIREEMVNPTLVKLFNLTHVQCFCRDLERKNYIRLSNEKVEEIYPFQFIVIKNEMKIGYRYTSLPGRGDEIKRLLDDYKIDKVVIIDWSAEINARRSKQDDRVSVISVEDFLKEYFKEALGSFIFESFKKAVEKANEDIGFQTIPKCSLRYLSAFKAELLREISNVEYSELRYRVLYLSDKKSKVYETISFSEEDYRIMNKNFKEKGLYRALIGTEGFAKCFVTAEYLFNIFREGNSFDYTSVISGYLKAVEQLVYMIVKSNLANCTEKDEFWIKGKYPKNKKDRDKMSRKNPKTRYLQVLFTPKNEPYFDVTLAPLLWFLNDSNRYKLSDEGNKAIHDLMLRYSQECRNDHFHKDNIDSFKEVESIRNNTYLIMYLLLGACKMSGDINLDIETLGIVDDAFDRLYKRLIEIPGSVNKFYIQFGTGEAIAVRRLLDQGDVRYDEFGSVSESVVRFVLEENCTDIEDENGMSADIVISKEHMPEKMWFVKHGGERVSIKW